MCESSTACQTELCGVDEQTNTKLSKTMSSATSTDNLSKQNYPTESTESARVGNTTMDEGAISKCHHTQSSCIHQSKLLPLITAELRMCAHTHAASDENSLSG